MRVRTAREMCALRHPPRSLDFAHARSVFEKFSRVKFLALPYADSARPARLTLGPAQACGAKSEY